MRASFLLLSITDLLLLALTAGVGLMVSDLHFFERHYLLGVLSGMFTCLVHVVLFMYFVVQDKIVKQSVVHYGLGPAFAVRVDMMKSSALRLSMTGIFAILLTVGLGAAIGILVPPAAHLVAAFAAIGVNGLVFVFQYDLLRRYAEMFQEAFGET